MGRWNKNKSDKSPNSGELKLDTAAVVVESCVCEPVCGGRRVCDCEYYKMCGRELSDLLRRIENACVGNDGLVYDTDVSIARALMNAEAREWRDVVMVGQPKYRQVVEAARGVLQPMLEILNALEAGERDWKTICRAVESELRRMHGGSGSGGGDVA